jgi:hypothetical protein
MIFVKRKIYKMKQLFVFILVLLSIFGCQKSEKQRQEMSFVQKIEKAHNKEKFNQEEVIQFDLKLSFNGQERINGKVTLQTNSSKGKITFADGNTIIYDGRKVYYSPELNDTSVRFDAYTWSYFFLFPFKLSDSGTKWEYYTNIEKDAKKFNTEKLTFEPKTGDAPDDWYVVYSVLDSDLIQKVAYIVTNNGTKEEAEKNPHAIQYSNYEAVNGIPIATRWQFWGWNKKNGLTEQLGEATLTNIEFIKNDSLLFAISQSLKISKQ